MKTKRIWIVTLFLVLLAAFAALPVMAGSSMMHVPRNAQFSSIVYQIRHANTAGKVYVDDARLDMIPVDVSC